MGQINTCSEMHSEFIAEGNGVQFIDCGGPLFNVARGKGQVFIGSNLHKIILFSPSAQIERRSVHVH